MRTQPRALSLEAIEDRSLPSTFLFVQPNFGYHRFEAPDTSFVSFHGRGFEAQTFRAETLIRVRFGDDTAVIVREQPTWFQLIPVTVSYNPPASTPQGPTGDGETSATNGSAGDTGGSTPVVASHGPVRSTAANAPVSAGDVAVVLPAQSNTGAAPATAEQNAASVAAQVAVQNGPPAVAPATPLLTGYGNGISYATTAIVPAADDAADDIVPPATPVPLAPAPVPDTAGVESGIVEVAAAAVTPMAGLVPFDFSALQSGAGQFLGRVADLAPSWPDGMPGLSDSLWVAAAALLTGGAAYAANTRSAPRPARDPLAGALSEWERRHGRLTG